ncbi:MULTISPECIES: ABC transporter ATP-binding protein [Sulfitobacter]|uniref:ABC transporter ATP-binding protein n=1 Tax=Sulfitobacter profundi TaxID=2679961 RepID=A0ABW1Z2L7_9RHOB|nr:MULTISPECIES: ABC transporter ATP-binding protein [Sulfitobacter]AYE88094.1 ABC transporter ATP-binding protein [Sulfitobacter sp. D7]MBO9432203.1 ABC transporter ATP-binding protein [Sulfitobacter sp. R18_1]MCZ4368370.1 ABC transporter ATP-binding protein [Sulfitobacter dubius]
MTSLLSVQSLAVSYGPIEAVRGIDFEIKEGEIVAFLGANGAGKSSTLNALVGLVPVASGAVYFKGKDITDWAPELLAPAGMTLSPEGRRVFGSLSVAENLRMGAFAITDKAAVKSAWDRVYDLFPILHERRDQFAGTLSGGQQQMLAVGRALMSNPKLLLLDEPSLGLAPKIIGQVFELIERLRGQGVTLAVVEQNVAMALEVADRGYVFANGQIVAAGSAADLAQSDTLKSAYLGGE